ncbi:MAG: hypothetical protein GEV12_12180 [Micromonosporaceae bacterium]|nr:hypothetical protein [Micromonosporaceae bacterium]
MAKRSHTGSGPATSPGPGLIVGRMPLEQVEVTLRLLCAGPQPPAVDGRRVGCGLPRRRIRLDELASVLAHPSTGQQAKQIVWAQLVERARAGEPAWVVGAAGVALPGLRRAARRLARANSHTDVEADLLEGFLAALAGVDTARPRICGRLVNAAHTHARAALNAQEAAASGEAHWAPGSALPPPPYGHPDLVLARAVRQGIISAGEADLIGATRLEDVPLAPYADREGLTAWAVYKRRRKAERRLVDAIRAGQLSDPVMEVVAEATQTTVVDRNRTSDQREPA